MTSSATTRTVRRVSMGLTVAATSVALAGCSGSPQGRPASPPPTAPAAATTSSATSPPPSPTATPTPTAPTAGTTLATIDGNGRQNVIAAQSGFDYVESLTDGSDDESHIVTYDVDGTQLATIPSGGFTGECGAADVTNASGRLVVTEDVVTTPAAGIVPATTAVDLTAWDAHTGTQVWKSRVVPDSPDGDFSCTAYDGELRNFAPTLDGHWALSTWYTGSSVVRDVVDLTDGSLHPRPDATGVLGNWVVTGNYREQGGSPTATLVVPGSSTAAGAFDTTSSLGLADDGSQFALPGVTPNADDPSVSPDSAVVFTAPGHGSGDEGVRAYALPSGTGLWSQPGSTSLVATAPGLVVVDVVDYASNTESLQGLDARTGAARWKLPSGQVCGVTSTQMLLLVNSQLATIDLASGKQLSYTDSTDKDTSGYPACPDMRAGGIGVDSSSINTVVVTQLLAP